MVKTKRDWPISLSKTMATVVLRFLRLCDNVWMQPVECTAVCSINPVLDMQASIDPTQTQ